MTGRNRDICIDDGLSTAKSTNSSSYNLPFQRSGRPLENTRSHSPAQTLHMSHYKRKNSSNQAGPIERDFYRNPTILSRMILFGKYTNANKRCRDRPIEASVWVCAKRKSNVVNRSLFHGIFEKKTGIAIPQQAQQKFIIGSESEYSLRQLPIHIACTSLAFTHDAHLRAELEQLIVRLVVTYPEGCSHFDHGGKLALHEAIWSNASPQTISMLIMASPQSIDQHDKFGRTPKELNARRLGKNKAEITDMLNLGWCYWDDARQEARLRMKLAVIPPSNQSIASTNVMGSSRVDTETIATGDTDDCNKIPVPNGQSPTRQKRLEGKQQIDFTSEEIIPMAWEQLERRVILLEQLLSEMHEKNYELGGLIEELLWTKKNAYCRARGGSSIQQQVNQQLQKRYFVFFNR